MRALVIGDLRLSQLVAAALHRLTVGSSSRNPFHGSAGSELFVCVPLRLCVGGSFVACLLSCKLEARRRATSLAACSRRRKRFLRFNVRQQRRQGPNAFGYSSSRIADHVCRVRRGNSTELDAEARAAGKADTAERKRTRSSWNAEAAVASAVESLLSAGCSDGLAPSRAEDVEEVTGSGIAQSCTSVEASAKKSWGVVLRQSWVKSSGIDVSLAEGVRVWVCYPAPGAHNLGRVDGRAHAHPRVVTFFPPPP